MRIYNPTYGALFEFDEAKPADPKEIGAWQLSYASPERGLTSNEIQKLLSNGKIGSYPDEIHLVGSEQWPLSRVQTHQRAVKAFEAVNREGPRFAHKDKLGNMRERIVVNFVSGPIVDLILASKSVEEAASKVYEMILSDVAAQFRKLKSFQAMAQTHAQLS